MTTEQNLDPQPIIDTGTNLKAETDKQRVITNNNGGESDDLQVLQEGLKNTWNSLSPRSRAGMKLGSVAVAASLIIGGAYKLGEGSSSGSSDESSQLNMAEQIEPGNLDTEPLAEEEGENTVIDGEAQEESYDEEVAPVYDREITDMSLVPEEFTENSALVLGSIEQVIDNNEPNNRNETHIHERTISFWRGAALKRFETTEGDQAIIRFENPLIVETDGGDLYFASYHLSSNQLITYLIGHVERGEVPEEDAYIFTDREGDSTNWRQTRLFGIRGDDTSGQMAYLTPSSISEKGVYGYDEPARMLRDEEGSVYSTAVITKLGSSGITRGLDLERGDEGSSGRLHLHNDEIWADIDELSEIRNQ